jgi:hypothetical protein
MRKITLLLGSILSISTLFSQVNLTVPAPVSNGGTSTLRAPNGTAAHTTFRGHLIIPASELTGIPVGTSLNGLGFSLSTAPDVAATGTMKFYLQNTTDVTNLKSLNWATAIATMTNVFNATMTIPAAVGPADVVLSTNFTYTGGGLYVAYDYLGTTFSTTAAAYECNTTIAGGVKVQATATTTPATDLTGSSGFRPVIRFRFPNPFTDNLAVLGVTADKGKDNLIFGTTQSVYTTIRNSSSATLTNKVVTLTVAGANPYTTTQTIASIAPGADANLTFSAVPKTIAGSQTLTVSVPADQQTANDAFVSNQNIYCDTVGYSAGNTITGGLGYNTGGGIFANLLIGPSAQPMYVKKVRPTIATGTAVTGNTIKGVLLNAAGVIIDSTALYTIVAGDLGLPVELTFINGNIDISGDSVYYGFRQNANTVTGYFPLATQSAFIVLPNKYCGFNTFGGGFFTDTQFGVFMIAAVVKAGINLTSNATNGSICSATPLNLSASSTFTNYQFNIDGMIAANGPATTYSYTPTATTTAIVSGSIGSCVSTDSVTVSLVSSLNTALAGGICPGGSYTFAGQTLSTVGTYYDTLTSTGGCDSVVTLTLANYIPTSSSITAGICPGATVTFGTQTLTAPGTYTRTIPNAQGCDSTITLTLTAKLASSASIAQSFCEGGTLTFGTQTISAPGTYTRTIPNAAGCDSVITLTATYQVINTIVTQSGSNLTVPTQTGATYKWINCPSFTGIAGGVNPTFHPITLTGSYAVVVTINGCKDTSACISVDQTGLADVNLSNFVEVYPNPTSDVLNVESNSFGIINYKVIDLNGRVILSEGLQGSSNSLHLSTVNFEKGTYILDLNTEYGSVKKVFIKQ